MAAFAALCHWRGRDDGHLSGFVGALFRGGWRPGLPVPFHSLWVVGLVDQPGCALVVCAITSGPKTHHAQATDGLILFYAAFAAVAEKPDGFKKPFWF